MDTGHEGLLDRTSIGTWEVEHMLRHRVKSRCWGVGSEKVLVSWAYSRWCLP